MKTIVIKKKARFIIMSLLWSVVLYACMSCIVHWNDITGKSENTTVVYSGNSINDNLTSVRIHIDSLNKRIRLADVVLQYLQLPLQR